jgi:hypothetical protein
MTRRERPEWRPLEDALRQQIGEFMWMFEVELFDGTLLQAYKHIHTRRYVHLAPDGTAFTYESPDRYRPLARGDGLAAVRAAAQDTHGDG